MGLSAAEPPVVVICELKLSFNLELILQAVDRAAAADEVWIAARVSARGKGREGDRRYVCGMITRPADFLRWLPARWEAAAGRRFARWVAAGSGCDSDIEPE